MKSESSKGPITNPIKDTVNRSLNLLNPLECEDEQSQSVKAMENERTIAIERTNNSTEIGKLNDKDLNNSRRQPKRRVAEEANDKIFGQNMVVE